MVGKVALRRKTSLGRKFISIFVCMLMLIMLVPPSVVLAGENQWTSNGPNDGSGSPGVNTVAFSPNYANDKVLFAGTLGGLYKSTDSGASWSRLLSGCEITAIGFSPNYATDRTLFIGVESSNYCVYKSTDGGANWVCVHSSNSFGNYIYSIAVSPNYANDGTVFFGTFQAGIYESTNRGASWTCLYNGLHDVCSIAISPNYATDATVYAGGISGLQKSADGGVTWTDISNGLASRCVLSLALSPNYAADKTLFIGGTRCVNKSTDGGVNWTDASDGISSTVVYSIALSPNYATDATLFAGASSGGVYKSTSGGTSWAQVNSGFPTSNLNISVAVSPCYATDKTIFAGNAYGGVFGYTFPTDAIPPTTTLSISPAAPDGTNGWYKSAPTITLASNEPGATQYKFDQWNVSYEWWYPGQLNTYTGPISAPEGIDRLRYYSSDGAANTEFRRDKEIKVDLTPPVLTSVPGDQVYEATGSNGAVVNFEATATDNLSTPTITYSKNPGTVFPFGTTQVTVTATDEAGNTSTKSFNVTVQDTTAPDLTVPSDITVEATGPDGAKVDFESTATDAVGPITITYSKNPGTVFPLGDTTVTATARDGAGNSISKSFKVTVQDTIAPPVPSNLKVVGEGPGIAISWSSVTDVVGPVAYKVERSTDKATWSLIATTADTNYTDMVASENVRYFYRVSASDGTGNASGPSSTVSGFVDTQAPTTPANLSVTRSSTSLRATWSPSTDNVGVTGYRVERSTDQATWTQIGTATATSYTDTSVSSNVRYYYRVKAVDTSGNISNPSNVANGIVDTQAPTVPTNLVVTRSGSGLKATWSPSTDNVGVNGYRLERSTNQTTWTQIAMTAATSYTDTSTVANVRYYYRVRAYDAWGNTSARSTVANGIVDTKAPTVPANIVVTRSGTSLKVAWSASTDNVGVNGYRLERSTNQTTWTQVAMTGATSYTDTSVSPNVRYYYRVRAYDAWGNTSARSTVANGIVDTQAPSAPSTLSIASSNSALILSWSAATDNVGVTSYTVQRSTDTTGWTDLATVNAPTASYTDASIESFTTYRYRILAKDAAGNVSLPSPTATATTYFVF